MKYTFEFTIAGCSTNCAHCYVDGGPASQMKLDDYKACVEKLKPILEKLNGDIYVTLGNEPFCHRSINEILHYNAHNLAGYFSFLDYPVPTTGIALINRSDKDEILHNLQAVGTTGCMLAVHGTEQLHNRTVCHPNAYAKLFETADFFSKSGFEVLFNFIVSKTLCVDFEQLMQKVSAYSRAKIRLTVPLYVPTKRLRAYQRNRAEYEECLRLAEPASAYSIDTSNLLECCHKYNENHVIRQLNSTGFDYSAEKSKAIQWKFFNVTQSGDLYYGNVGAHTKRLGNLLHTPSNEILEQVLSTEPNYDYTAYYDDEAFFHLEKHLRHLQPRTHNYVYNNKQDCLYALLDEIGVPNIIMHQAIFTHR